MKDFRKSGIWEVCKELFNSMITLLGLLWTDQASAEQPATPHGEAWSLPLRSFKVMRDESLQQPWGLGDMKRKPREGKKFAPSHTAAQIFTYSLTAL